MDPYNPDATNNEIISRNLVDNVGGGDDGLNDCLSNAGTHAHNDGLVRDANGYLATLPDPSGTPAYWIYYADNFNLSSDNWHIARVPFTVN